MGRDKLLLPYRGKPLLCAALEAALGSTASPVVCVVGPKSELPPGVLAQEGEFHRIHWAVNPEASSGRASSIRVGLEALPESCAAALFLPGDVPGVRAEEVESLLVRFRQGEAPALVAVEPDGAFSHPVLFAREFFPQLSALEGDNGARGILTEMGNRLLRVTRRAAPLWDVDTPEDYRRLTERDA